MIIEWKEEYSVHVEEIDEQHKKFIGIMDKLYISAKNFTTNDHLKQILDELLDYTHTHFNTEEKYFDRFHYELADEHKKKHRELLEKVEKFLKAHAKFGKDVSFELLDFLEDWLVEHLNNEDKKYTKCFNEHGLF